MITPPILEAGDRQTAIWQKLVKYLEAELVKLRAKNDGDLNDRQTARLRGRIDAVKSLLSLGTDSPKAPSEDALFKD